MRFPHYITENRGSGTPHNVIFFDTETTGEVVGVDTIEATLNFGWACYTRRIGNGKWSAPKWQRFEDASTFWDFVYQFIRPKRRLYIMAHNLNFDLAQVKGFYRLQSDGWETTSRIIGPKILNLTYRRDGASIRLVDTYNYYPMGLKAVGAMVGLEKYEFPEDTDDAALWDTYCRRDVEIMLEAMQLWWRRIKDWQLGNFGVTLASQCMNAYRHRFMKTPIFIDTNKHAARVSRKSYLGGRNEAYFLGPIPERVWCLDINSMYPYIMRTYPMPYRLATTRTDISPANLSKLLETYSIVADVELDVTEPVIPIRYEGRTTWPLGSFHAALTSPELAHALNLGMVTKVHYAALYLSANIFREYVDFFYGERIKARAAGDTATEGITKLFLNNLYGKFGQKGERWTIIGDAEDIDVRYYDYYDLTENKIIKRRQFAGVLEELQGAPDDGDYVPAIAGESRDSLPAITAESRDSFPGIAAHVTAYARMYLWRLMEAAGRENVYYTDTDSLMVNKAGYDALKPFCDPTELGYLKVEWESDDVVINGLKDYRVDNTVKIKGIRKDAIETRPGVFRQDQFRGIHGMIRAGDMDRILIKTIEKTLLRRYQKGRVAESGRVFPLLILR